MMAVIRWRLKLFVNTFLTKANTCVFFFPLTVWPRVSGLVPRRPPGGGKKNNYETLQLKSNFPSAAQLCSFVNSTRPYLVYASLLTVSQALLEHYWAVPTGTVCKRHQSVCTEMPSVCLTLLHSQSFLLILIRLERFIYECVNVLHMHLCEHFICMCTSVFSSMKACVNISHMNVCLCVDANSSHMWMWIFCRMNGFVNMSHVRGVRWLSG